MLRIQYDLNHQVIELSMTDNFSSWPDVRRVFEENAEDFSITSAHGLRLPVWTFLSCRRQLGYILSKHRIKVDLDANANTILTSAQKNEEQYQNAQNSSPVSEDLLISELNKIGFTRNLTEHQIRNVARLVTLPSGATFSVPGAGKTTEALAFYFYRKDNKTKLLVVCPKNAFPAWEEQLELCVEYPPKITRLTGGRETIKQLLTQEQEIMLITYAQLPNVKDLVASYMAINPTFLFLDESHRIKRGASGVRGSTVLDISHMPQAKLLMSGTPLPNALSDIVPQFDFLYPEIGAETENVVDLVEPIFVRTTKAELGLPSPIRKLTPVQMKPKQRHLYELMSSEEARRLEKMTSGDRILLRDFSRAVVRLLQMTSNPALLAKEEINFPAELYDVLREGDSPKIEYACQKARILAQQNKKVIIWSNFVENVELLAERLADLGADYIHGGVEAGSEEEENTRERKIKRFHDDNQAFVLVANPAACAEGISLHTVCHYALYVDRNYNAAQYLQSEDRIHRLGLPEDTITTVEILYCPDSIDEAVDNRLKIKVDRMAKVLGDNSLNIEPVITDLDEDGLDDEDIADLLIHLKRM